MRDINQKPSDTDKQIVMGNSTVAKPFAFRRSVWLSSLNSKRAISTGGLSIFAVAALLGIKPAQANITDQSHPLPDQSVFEEQTTPTNSQSSELEAQTGFSQGLALGESHETASPNVQTIANFSSNPSTSELRNLKLKEGLTPVEKGLAVIPELENNRISAKSAPTQYNFAPFAIEQGHFSSLEQHPSTKEAVNAVPIANSLSFADPGTTIQNPYPQAIGTEFSKPATVQKAFVSPSTESSPTQDAVEEKVIESEDTPSEQPSTIVPGVSFGATAFSPTASSAENKVGEPESTLPEQPSTIIPGFSPEETAFSSTEYEVDYKVWDPSVSGKQPKAILPPFAYQADAFAPILNPAQPRVPQPVTGDTQSTLVAQATAPDATVATSEPYKGPGGAAMLGDNIQAQSSIIAQQESSSTENSPQFKDPLAPELTLEGGFITQGETGARARVTGLYPVSPNLLFGGTVDFTAGDGLSDTGGTGLDLNELYFTASLPSYPNLRLTAGLLDLTSYFDRNSFAKDSLTHFFHPVFQTNPALAKAGIASRPAVLLNWDITDNFQARAAGFSSSRSPSELALDAFAGELAFRFDNGIIRGTYVDARDNGINGFEEVYGIPRGNNEFGPRSSDRESSYGINAEYYIPEIKMGLFGRYGHYQNTTIGRGGDTYSVGFNLLDLFMKDDRLGFGYGRDLSNSSLRRASGNKLPDVWEVFYDFRLTSYLRAAVALQARDEFSDIVAGFRVKTEFDLLNLGRTFK